MAYPFLSDAWFDAVEALRDRAPAAPEEVADIAVNMVVTGGPDGDRSLHFAEGRFDRGLVEGAPTTVTLPTGWPGRCSSTSTPRWPSPPS